MSSAPTRAVLRVSVEASLGKNWLVYLIEGIVLIAIGLAAIFFPPVATLAATIFIGWLLLISGAVGLATTLYLRGPGFMWSILSAILGIVAGAVLLAAPESGAISLTILVGFFFLIEGVVSLLFALDHRVELPSAWVWMLLSGIVDLLLGGVVLAGLPGTAAWTIGLLVGINMLFGGIALVAMALAARSLATDGR